MLDLMRVRAPPVRRIQLGGINLELKCEPATFCGWLSSKIELLRIINPPLILGLAALSKRHNNINGSRYNR